MRQATRALAANLVSKYEQARPDLVPVILESHGFSDLLERVYFLHRIGTRGQHGWHGAAGAGCP